MNTLIIKAHPSKKGFTHKIAESYRKSAEDNLKKVDVLDLYDEDLKLDFLRFEELKSIKLNDKVKRIQDKILKSDELIFVFPIWWWDSPAVLKNFFDNIFSSWFAFKYEKWKPVWLLDWKIAKIFATCDAPALFYKLPFIFRLRTLWWSFRLWFCWIDLKNFEIFWNMRKSSKETKDKYLDKVEKLAKKIN